MVQFLSINFFLGFLQFLLDFSKVPVFLCHSVVRKLKGKFKIPLTFHRNVTSAIGQYKYIKRHNPRQPRRGH